MIKTALLLLSLLVHSQYYDFSKANQLLDSLEQKGYMGVVAQIYKGDNLLFQRAVGFSDHDSNEKNTIETLFKIGSITKIYTSSLILLAQEEGKLNINDKLSEYFPSIQGSENISLLQMLQHRSGLKNYTDLVNFEEIAMQDWSRNQIMTLLEGFEPRYVPDSQFEYSNTNYLLLGYILEQIEGKPFGQILEQKLLKPNGLSHTFMIGATYKGSLAKSYAEGQEIDRWNPSWSSAAGGIISNVSDVNRFLSLLMEGHIVQAQNLELMLQLKDNYGLGVMSFPFYEAQGIGHTGGIEAFRSSTTFFPQGDLSITILSNENTNFKVSNNDIGIALLSAVYKKKYELPNFTIAPSQDIDSTILESLVGTYHTDAFPLDIKIFLNEDQLMAQATGQGRFPLRCIDNQDLVFDFEAADITMKFERIENNMKMHYKQYNTKVEFNRK